MRHQLMALSPRKILPPSHAAIDRNVYLQVIGGTDCYISEHPNALLELGGLHLTAASGIVRMVWHPELWAAGDALISVEVS